MLDRMKNAINPSLSFEKLYEEFSKKSRSYPTISRPNRNSSTAVLSSPDHRWLMDSPDTK
jgi:hypothetical protein